MHRLLGQSTSLADFPTELLLKIICSLPSFTGALPLLSTCRRCRAILVQHANSIYQQLNSDPWSKYALVLLNDHQNAVLDVADLTASHILSLSRFTQNAQNAMNLFESTLRVLTIGGRRCADLTPGERDRFIRAYYQVWGLMKLETNARKDRMDRLTLRRLFYVRAMAKLGQPVGDEPGPYYRDYRPSEKRKIIEQESFDIIVRKYNTIHQNNHGEDVIDEAFVNQNKALYQGDKLFLDIFQGDLECALHGAAPRFSQFTREYSRDYIWDSDFE